jgi:hypothetical protein
MVNHVRSRAYTKTARWYNLTCLAVITLGSIILVISTLLGTYETGGFTVEVFRSVAIALAGILGILGIFQEKLWAKWFAIISYGLCIFAIIEGIMNSLSARSSFQIISPNVSVALGVMRLIVIVILLVGAIFLLRKPVRKNEESK